MAVVPVNGPALLALQLVDLHLDQLDGRRSRLPERAVLDAAQAEHAHLVGERARLTALVDAASTSIEQAEKDGAALDTKKARLNAQLKTVIAPREAEALMHEIEMLDTKHSELDDVELAAMDDQSTAEAALAELATTEPKLLETVAAAQAALDEAVAAIAAESSAAAAERTAAAAALTDAEQQLYDSLRARYKGAGICTLERHTCSGCHVDLSQVEYETVIHTPAGELPECPHCARLLVV
jgi:uncharacterized protein